MTEEHFCYIGRLPFDEKFLNLRNGSKGYGNFIGKFPKKLLIIQSKILGVKSNATDILGQRCSENLGIAREVVLFPGKSLPEISVNANQTFWSNGKCPLCN